MTPEQVAQLIERYGAPAYALALRQTRVDLITTTLFALFVVVGAIASARFAIARYRAYNAHIAAGKPSYDTTDEIAAAIGAFVAFALGVIMLLVIDDLVTLVVNPEWHALQLLLDSAR